METVPWVRTLKAILERCENKKHHAFKYYGEKGIKCKITKKELKHLWFRDKGYLMKCASIDRINPMGDYKFSNCRYLELSENLKRAKRDVCLKNLVRTKIKLKHLGRL